MDPVKIIKKETGKRPFMQREHTAYYAKTTLAALEPTLQKHRMQYHVYDKLPKGQRGNMSECVCVFIPAAVSLESEATQ